MEFDLKEEEYHLLLATGPMSGEKKMNYHTSRASSKDLMDLYSSSKLRGASNVIVKGNQALMAVAWLAAALARQVFAE